MLRSGANVSHAPPKGTGLCSSWFLASSGRNDKGQLGHGDTKRLEAPKLIEALADHVIVAAACGRNHTLALTGRLSPDIIRGVCVFIPAKQQLISGV